MPSRLPELGPRPGPAVNTAPTGSPRVVHHRAARHPGPLCGTDDTPSPRGTTDPHLVTCPDCDPVTTELDALPDDATAGDPAIIQLLRQVAGGAWRKID